MRVLCLSAPLPGHLDWGGYWATAAELARRGHTLLWASGEAVRGQVTRAGLAFHALAETGWRWPPPPPLPEDAHADPAQMQRVKQLRALDQWLDVARVAAAMGEINALAQAFQPDLILSEMFVAAAGLVAEQVNCPLLVMGWPAPAPQTVTGADGMALLARQRLEKLLGQFGLTGQHWTPSGPPALCAPLGHITYWSPNWFSGVAMGPQTAHMGGLRPTQPRDQQTARHQPDASFPPPDDAPWVLITLGTSFNADPNFFIAAAQAAEQLGCLPILALGAAPTTPWVQQLRGRLPRRASVRVLVDFARVLPDVAVAIHHGGAGTTHALVTHAVPQIIVPHAADQVRQAQGVLRSGVGLHLPPKQVTIPRLMDALAHLLPDRAPARAQASALQAEFHALGGVPAAADRVEALAQH